MFLTTILAAALLGSGVANAKGTLKASQYGTPDYTLDQIALGSAESYDTLVVDETLMLTGSLGFLDLYNGATLAFSKENGAEAICSIFTLDVRANRFPSVYFNNAGDVYNFTFDADAQAIVASSAGTPITLIQDLREDSVGFSCNSSSTLKLNGVGYNATVELGGVQFTYVGPKAADYVFQTGEIGFTGYEEGSHALKLVANGKPTPEPTTGTLSLLALAGLCARRRK